MYVPVTWLADQHGFCACGAPLTIQRHRKRPLQTLKGKWLLTQKDRRCSDAEACTHREFLRPAPAEARLVLKGTEYGLDIIALVGERHIKHQRSFAEIHRELSEREVFISERHVANLFRLYLAIVGARTVESPAVVRKLTAQGRLILSVDAVQFDDVSPKLYVVREELSEEILLAERIELADTSNLVAFLRRVNTLGLPVAGVISDKEAALIAAIATVFPEAPHQYCQTHYLGHLVKPMEAELAQLGAAVEDVAKEARKLSKRLGQLSASSEEEKQLATKVCKAVEVISNRRGDKILDPPALKRYNDMSDLASMTRKAVEKRAGTWPLLDRLLQILAALLAWDQLARRLTLQVEIVRQIAHILDADVKGKTIQRRLEAFLTKLAEEAPARGIGVPRGRFHLKVIAITKRFWKGLFACYDVPDLPGNNNALESFFRSLKWHYRRVQGKKSTAGGVMESIAPFIVLLWPELHRRPNLQALVEEMSAEELVRARTVLDELAEPARARRSFIRDPEGHLKAMFEEWHKAPR